MVPMNSSDGDILMKTSVSQLSSVEMNTTRAHLIDKLKQIDSLIRKLQTSDAK
jgi:hypothetical protein